MMLRQFRRRFSFTLYFLTAVLAVSCGSPVAEEPPVEYGATLNEWEEAQQTAPADGAADQSTDVDNALLAAIEESRTSAGESGNGSNSDLAATGSEETAYQQIMWDVLVPPDYRPEAIMEKYAPQLAALEDGSPEATTLYRQMQEEFNRAPVNEALDQTLVKIPGFIAPLEYSGELITEFLLVPYFGACIHVPPPPVNQTILIKTAEGEGINTADSYNPVWVIGMITAEGTVTELANAGYSIENATIEPYTSP